MTLVFALTTLLMLWMGGTTLVAGGFAVRDAVIGVLLLLVAGGTTTLCATLAKGLWQHEPWVPGTLTALHAVVVLGWLARMWRGEEASIGFLLVNGLIVCLFQLPSVRRWFAR